MYYTYVIFNQLLQRIYIGQTNNLEKRLQRHNQNLPTKKTSYTSKHKGVWKLVYQEMYNTRKEAIKREKELKSYQGRKFIKNIIFGPVAQR